MGPSTQVGTHASPGSRRGRESSIYTKIWKESHRDLEAPRIVSTRDQFRADQKQLIQMQNLGIGFVRIAPADNDRGYARRQDKNVLDSIKRERLESKLSQIRNVFIMPDIVFSHTRVGFILGSEYKYQTPTIVRRIPISQIQVNYFF